MKKLFTTLAIIASLLAIIFAILPISNLAIIPSILALVFGLLAFYFSRKTGQVKKIIQFTFLLTIMALAITTYKALFIKTEVADTQELKATESQSKEEALEELEDLEIDDIEIDAPELEDIEL
ncbi:FUSC family protein [Seonamhaeicola sediminis]|uniref:FUSC family protein n=1 Tax=Seonamhaeicola sediminis TaxID=2528206 RepID=A0A562YC91_9FLAO|nr:FUSC family protein [Seonamhaeicola sediminis]TWO31722.1 FUSC family protein [Seonamhaeicola sediminis]